MTWDNLPHYDDVVVLQETGCWPDCVTPAWAMEISAEYECDPTASAVLQSAMVFEIDRLRTALSSIREWLCSESDRSDDIMASVGSLKMWHRKQTLEDVIHKLDSIIDTAHESVVQEREAKNAGDR